MSAPSPPAPGQLSHQVGAVVFGRVAVSILESLKTFLLVRMMGKAEFGTLSLALAWYATAQGLGLLAIPDSLLIFLPRLAAPKQKGLMRQSLLVLTTVGIAAGLLVAGMALVMRPQGHADLLVPLLIVAGVVALDLPGNLLASFLLGTQRHQLSSQLAIGLALVGNLAVLVPAALGAAPAWILASFGASCVLRLLVTLGVLQRLYGSVAAEPFDGGVRAQLAFAIPLSLNGIAGLVNRYTSTWLAGFLLSAAVFADFAVGAQELPFVSMLAYGVAVAMLPQLSALAGAPGDRSENARKALALWHVGIDKVALVMLPIFAFSMIAADDVLGLLYGERYRSAALPFRLTALMLPLRVTSYGTMLMALDRPRAILRAQLAGIVLNLLGTAGLLAWVHARPDVSAPVRVAWTAGLWTAATWIATAWNIGDIAKAAQVRYAQAFPWRGWLARLLCAALACLPALGVQALWPAGGVAWQGLGLGLRLVAFLASYLAVVLRVGLVSPADRAALGPWLRLEPLWRKSS